MEWSAREDLNLRSQVPQTCAFARLSYALMNGAPGRASTGDLRFTGPLLWRLSYRGEKVGAVSRPRGGYKLMWLVSWLSS